MHRSLNSSDVFEKTYTRQLARRLLLKTGYDIELEKRVVAAFKPECGENFGTMTELMFNNTSESELLVETFKVSTNKLQIQDFSFMILEQKTWPIDTGSSDSTTEETKQEA